MASEFDNEKVISTYQQHADELPPKEIDDLILIKSVRQQHTSRRWWSYIGAAACVGLLAILVPWNNKETLKDINELKSYELQDTKSDEKIRQIQGVTPDIQSEIFLGAPAAESLSNSQRMATKIIAPEPVSMENPFANIQDLLERGETIKAKQQLKKLLEERPELTDTLPSALKSLLSDNHKKRVPPSYTE
ncbi:hypothetical protein [Veronia pacifica]|uniref:Uncharacterized protein n=1 Tax=Veronia pacifica TaxID=1080227 RepID=A0A1C3EM66_9GAMM|nr:hypothetical protein [Veronia pacifica]ODA34347.1 hypothetical protein A8L45_06375 [Veronia pacifica]